MLQVHELEAGSRHDLHVGLSPDAPDEGEVRDDADDAFGYAHSYETSSRYDGPGLRVVLFVSGCLLRGPVPYKAPYVHCSLPLWSLRLRGRSGR